MEMIFRMWFLVTAFFAVCDHDLASAHLFDLSHRGSQKTVSLREILSDKENEQYDPQQVRVERSAGKSNENICYTSNCNNTADMILKKMDTSIDPCENFYDYACGRFLKEVVFKPHETGVVWGSEVTDRNNQLIKDLVSEAESIKDQKYLFKMKQFYKSCMDEDQIELNGVQDFLNDNSFIEVWPTLNKQWEPSSFSLKQTILKYFKVYSPILYKFSVYSDTKNSSTKAVYITKINSKTSIIFDKSSPQALVQVYQKYLTEIATTLGADQNVAEKDAEDVVNLEAAIHQVMSTSVETHDRHQYNKVSLSDLDQKYPDLYIGDAMKETFKTVNIDLNENDVIINNYPKYLENLSTLLNSMSSRTIQNLFAFTYAINKVESLTKNLRKIYQDARQAIIGSQEEIPRWETCLTDIEDAFPWGVSKQFVTKSFSQKAKTYMNTMIDNLLVTFKQVLDEATWMTDTTKESAYKKLASMKRNIGYPDGDFTEVYINKLYSKLKIDPKNFYSNTQQVWKYKNEETLASLRKPKNPNNWPMIPFKTNAFYLPSGNLITFLAGVLQAPIFSIQFQDYINYGSIGFVIGHEITHGYDTYGSHFNEEGNKVDWWQKSDYEIFQQKVKCFVDQYSAFHVDSVNMSVNGELTRGENVADSGGLKQSYSSYKKLVSEKGEQRRLPLLNLTQDQTFFLAYAQPWCEKLSPRREQIFLLMVITLQQDTELLDL